MDSFTADMLRALNNRFYRDNRTSFSATRRNSWPGWNRCVELCCAHVSARGARVLDVACGNMRFERYLREACGFEDFSYTGVDSCELFDELPAQARFVEADLLESCGTGENGLSELVGLHAFDLCACFGFFHHVPSQAARIELVEQLLATVRSGGHVAVSLWRFADVPELADKAAATTARARDELGLPELDAGDYLLGWQDRTDAYRYCHSFSEPEIDELKRTVGAAAELVERFEADGRTGAMNTYLVWRAC